MKKIFLIALAATTMASCCQSGKTGSATADMPMAQLIDQSLDKAVKQSLLMARTLDTMEGRLPRTIDKYGNLVTSDSRWWCSGFYPGVLWYLDEYKQNDSVEKYAEEFTGRVEREKYTTNNHDVGFMLYCSFGNGLRLKGTKPYEEVLVTGSNSLMTRYNPTVGGTRSWDFNKAVWQFPIIIDNMMNLEMLMWTFKHTGDSTYYKAAVSHADVTMKNHFRDDYSTWHVVSYDTLTGKPHIKQTNQGYADDSCWARGEAWALYGYTMMYRETGLERYLKQAENIANFMIKHPNMPDDYIPYWDFNAPDQPNAYRDASAAAIMASALIELSQYDKANSKKYLEVAEKQLRTLASDEYTAKIGTNGNFILRHSVGSLPGNSEVDVPLTYADYYYVEALMRFKKLLEQQ